MSFEIKHYHADSSTRIFLKDTLAKRSLLHASGQLMLGEMVPWVIDRYIRGVDYAKISFTTVGHNLLPSSWTWDNDDFGTNQFGHPYHGSLFYSAFRTNGYSFWQAVPATFAGSYVWETVAENQYPSPNDFINTGFGGVVLGEMTYRLSNKLINNRSRGVKRQLSEVLGLVINPMNGLNRILDGKWGKIGRNSPERDSSSIYAEIDIGYREFNVNYNRPSLGLYGHLKMLYGTPFQAYKTPFSNIAINTEFGKDDSSKVNIVTVYGSLNGWRVYLGGASKHLLVLSANYDYIHNEAFFYSAQSVKFNLFSNFELSRKIKMNTLVGAGPVILAAVPDGYGFKGRLYDYSSGLGFHANYSLGIAGKYFYSMNYRGGVLKTINGNRSYYILNAITAEVRYLIGSNISFCAEPGYFGLKGYYHKAHPDVNKTYPYLRISMRYSIDMQ